MDNSYPVDSTIHPSCNLSLTYIMLLGVADKTFTLVNYLQSKFSVITSEAIVLAAKNKSYNLKLQE